MVEFSHVPDKLRTVKRGGAKIISTGKTIGKYGTSPVWKPAEIVSRPFRAGKEDPLPELKMKPPKERLAMKSEVTLTPDGTQRFQETQTVTTKILHEKIRKAEQIEAEASQIKDPAERKTKFPEYDTPGHDLLLSLRDIEQAAQQPDGSSMTVPFLKDGKPLGKEVIYEQGGDQYRVNKIVGKNGDEFICEVVNKDPKKGGVPETKNVPIETVVRGQILAEESAAKSLFTGTPEEVIFDRYINAVKGEPDANKPFDLKDSAGADDTKAIEGFNDEMQKAGMRHNIVSMGHVDQAIKRAGYEEDTEPPENASEEKKRRWAEKQKWVTLKKTLETQKRNFVDYDTFKGVFGENYDNSVNALRTRVDQVQQDVRREAATMEDLQRVQEDLGDAIILQEAYGKDPNFLRDYYDSSNSGTLPNEASKQFIQAITTGNLTEFHEYAVPEINQHHKDVTQAQEKRAKEVKTKSRRRKVAVGTLAGLAALGYLISSKFTDEE